MLLQICAIGSVFFYVGPDTDVFTLNRLLDHETEIMYVEPLVAFRNRLRINAARSHNRPIDQLFECDHDQDRHSDCAEPLRMAHVRAYVGELLKHLVATSKCTFTGNALVHLRVHSVRVSLGRVNIAFTSRGIFRNMTVYVSEIQHMPSVLGGKKVTTFSRLGVGPNGPPAKRFVCRNIDRDLRIITNRHNPCVRRPCASTYVEPNPACRAVHDGWTGNSHESYSLTSTRPHGWCAKPRLNP